MAYGTNHQKLSLRARKFSKKVGTFPREKTIARKRHSASPLAFSELAVKLVERHHKANFNYYMDSCLKTMEKEKVFKGFSSEEKLRMTQMTHFSAGRLKRMTSGFEGVDKFDMNGKSKGVGVISNGLTGISALSQNPGKIFQDGCSQKSGEKKEPPKCKNHSKLRKPSPVLSPVPPSRKEKKMTPTKGMIMYGPGWKIRQLIKSKSVDAIVALHVKTLEMERAERGDLRNESNLGEECTNDHNECSGFQPMSAGGSTQASPFSSCVHQQDINPDQFIPLQPGSFQIGNTTTNSCPLQGSINSNYKYNIVSVPTSLVNSTRKRNVRNLPSIIQNGGGVREEKPQIAYNCSDDLYEQLKKPASSLRSLDSLMRSYRRHAAQNRIMMREQGSSEPRVDKKIISPPVITLDDGELLHDNVKCDRRVQILINSSSNTYEYNNSEDTEGDDVDVEGGSDTDGGSVENPILID